LLKEIAKEKLSEVIKAIVPIVAIVLILSVTIVPMPTHVVMVFFYGCILLMIGMVFFTIGSEQAMEPMGKHVGARITKTRKLYLILPLGLLLGFMITISEPDLQVLANQVQSIPNSVLIMSVSGGVAFFLAHGSGPHGVGNSPATDAAGILCDCVRAGLLYPPRFFGCGI
jgi:hypothetical protein